MVQGQGGVTVNSTPAEFDAEDDDMGVLLKVETLQVRDGTMRYRTARFLQLVCSCYS